MNQSEVIQYVGEQPHGTHLFFGEDVWLREGRNWRKLDTTVIIEDRIVAMACYAALKAKNTPPWSFM